MSEMIERVALAITDVFVSITKNRPGPHIGVTEDDMRCAAFAAINAMREPTEAMLDCGVAFALQASVHGMGGWTKYIAEKHRAMIDAELSRGIETRQGGDGTAPSRSDDSPSATRRAGNYPINTTDHTQGE